jgi:DNA-binding transcriptional regulator GbsR (MarR family)
MDTIIELERKVISLWEDIAEARGFDRAAGTVLCILFIENKPLSQQEIAEKTGYSIPTVSKTLKLLYPLGSIRRIKKPSGRVIQYYVEMSPLDVLSGTLIKWTLTTKTLAQRMVSIREELERSKSEDPIRAQKLLGMIRKLDEPIPKMIEIMENAIKEIRKINV